MLNLFFIIKRLKVYLSFSSLLIHIYSSDGCQRTESPLPDSWSSHVSSSHQHHKRDGVLVEALRSPETDSVVNIRSSTSLQPASKGEDFLESLQKGKSDDFDASLNFSKHKKKKKLFVNSWNEENVREHDHYPVDGPKHFPVFNFKEFSDPKIPSRKWTEQDIKKLRQVFGQGKYVMDKILENLDQRTFFSKLLEISQMEELYDCKIFILAIMSHGDGTAGQNFITSDDMSVSMDQVRAFFDDVHCPQLKGKPKIFLACFCRNQSVAPTDPVPSVPETKPSDSTTPLDNSEKEFAHLEESDIDALLRLSEDNMQEEKASTSVERSSETNMHVPETEPSDPSPLLDDGMLEKEFANLKESDIDALLRLSEDNMEEEKASTSVERSSETNMHVPETEPSDPSPLLDNGMLEKEFADLKESDIDAMLRLLEDNMQEDTTSIFGQMGTETASKFMLQLEETQNLETVSCQNNEEAKDLMIDNQASNPRNCTDMITMYSCKKGLRTARTNKHGIIFIDALCRAVAEHGWHFNVERIFADVEEKMREMCPDECDSLEGYDPDKKTAVFKTCYFFS
ncbi:Caspase-like domain [Trinorchestia longiramus]|nr:Caspase-like domain [Trinorchestia longiramus]